MAKSKTVYYCQSCGTQHLKWQGRCNGCGEWGTLVEEVTDGKGITRKSKALNLSSLPKTINEIDSISETRIQTPDREMNRVLGGGIVDGSVVLLGGQPGIGKSTLLLQLALQLESKKILYVSGEESERQIKMRADRIAYKNPNLYVASETNLEKILQFEDELQPDLMVVDSVQTVHSENLDSAPGSVSQVRECASRLIQMSKDTQIPLFLVGHITKDGMLAGPKVLEHMVDTVLTFEGDRHNSYRIVRTNKNRFGSTMEIGIYEMLADGLREVSNPSEIFLSNHEEHFSGVAISATLEGMRPLLVETQALVTPLAYGTPQRSATGFDLRRLSMLLAVLEKRSGIPISSKDVFINIAGGLKVEDPALDLGLLCSVVSSLHDISLPQENVFAAEVGLSGEVRAVNRLEPRIAEAEKLGFSKIYVARTQLASVEDKFTDIEIVGVGKLEEVFKSIFVE